MTTYLYSGASEQTRQANQIERAREVVAAFNEWLHAESDDMAQVFWAIRQLSISLEDAHA